MIHSRSIVISAAALWLMGCSTPQPAKEVALVDIPPPEIQRDLTLEQPAPGVGRICKLGDSCLTMDSRPFEACLVDTRHCVDKAVETLPAKVPKDAKPGGPVAVSQR
jgi:hypothetical protein